jgi:hypothetical protein
MSTDNLIEKTGVPEAKGSTDSDRRTETVNLVEMGSVSMETKGWIQGIELGFTPRAG